MPWALSALNNCGEKSSSLLQAAQQHKLLKDARAQALVHRTRTLVPLHSSRAIVVVVLLASSLTITSGV